VPRQKDAGDADAICDFYDARAREPVACARFGVCKILPSGNGKEWRAARVEEAVSLNFTPQNYIYIYARARVASIGTSGEEDAISDPQNRRAFARG